MDESSSVLDLARAIGVGTNRRQITRELRSDRYRRRGARRAGCDAGTGRAGRPRHGRGRTTGGQKDNGGEQEAPHL